MASTVRLGQRRLRQLVPVAAPRLARAVAGLAVVALVAVGGLSLHHVLFPRPA